MGTIMDLFDNNKDYVDNPYWSVFQIKVPLLKQPFSTTYPTDRLESHEKGNVSLSQITARY